MKKVFIILILLLLCMNLPSQAATWVQVSDYVYIDKDSIGYYIDDNGKEDTCKKTFWRKEINHDNLYKDVEQILKKEISYQLNQEIIDTTKKRWTAKSRMLYDKNGSVVFRTIYKDFELEWNPVVPESNGEFYFELVREPELLETLYKMKLQETSN